MKLREIINSIKSESCKLFIIERFRNTLDIEIEIPNEIEYLCKVLNILSNNIRLKIIYVLSKIKKAPVCLIASILNKDETLISHHLKHLKMVDLVIEKREGKFHIYELNFKKLNEVINLLTKILRSNDESLSPK